MANDAYQVFVALDGTALEGGKIYIGEANDDPELNPVNLYWDAAKTTPAAQPLRTSGGVIVRDGAPSDVFADVTAYSIRVRDRADRLVWYKSTTGGVLADRMTFPIPAGPPGADSTVPGPADNTYASLSAFKGSDIGRKTASLVGIPNVPDGRFNWTLGNYTGQADDVNIIKADSTALSVGAWVRQTAAGVSFKQAAAPIVRTTQDKAREIVSALDYGAIGDNTAHPVSEWIGAGKRYASLAALQVDYPHVTAATDYIDWAAIQKAINYLASVNGGTVTLPKSGGRWIINRGLKLAGNVRLQGPMPVRFPFNAGNAQSSALVADFADPMQWVIDCDSRINGQPLGYNDFYTGALPNGAIYDCGVQDLLVTSINALPFGGIRMAGVPGSTVKDVGVHRVGCGFLSNVCFGSFYSVHCLTAYYGFVGWDDFNGNTVEGYAARDGAYTGDVPPEYRLKPMNTLAGSLTAEPYRMLSSAHTSRATGIMCGSLGSTSNNNRFDVVIERFQTAHFLLYAYSTGFTKDYVEGSANQMQTVFAGAQSSIVLQVNHSYGTATGNLFDAGRGFDADINCNGSLSLGSFGSVALLPDARITLRTITIDQFGPNPPQFNVLYEQVGSFKPLSLQNSWGNAGQFITPAYRREGLARRVFLQGAVAGGANNAAIAQLPAGYRPFALTPFPGFDVAPDGTITARTGATISLTGMSFEATA